MIATSNRAMSSAEEPTTAGYLVAGIQKIGILDCPRLRFLIEAGTVGDDREAVVCLRVLHSGGHEYILPHEVCVLRAGSSLDDAANNRVSLGRIVKLFPRLGDQRIILEEIESRLDRIVEMLRIPLPDHPASRTCSAGCRRDVPSPSV